MLVAGAGGGFDVFAGLPLYFALTSAGKHVELANLSFTYLGGTTAPRLGPGLFRVEATSEGEPHYFPERHLAEWLGSVGMPGHVHAFELPLGHALFIIPLRCACVSEGRSRCEPRARALGAGVRGPRPSGASLAGACPAPPRRPHAGPRRARSASSAP